MFGIHNTALCTSTNEVECVVGFGIDGTVRCGQDLDLRGLGVFYVALLEIVT